MRKVWLIFITIAVLMVVLALPAAAAAPNGKSCNNSWNWSPVNSPAITQPTVPSIPGNVLPAVPATGNTGNNIQDSKLDLSKLFEQAQSQFENCLNGLFGNLN